MPKVATRLNDTQIKRAKASDKNYELSDGEGLILRVLTSGTKSWIFRYSPPYTKKRTNISFGTYPLITLKEARQLREEARTLLAKNIDPKEHKKQAEAFEISEAQNTFRLVAQKWFASQSACSQRHWILQNAIFCRTAHLHGPWVRPL